ncbi:MAG: hypothetical protein ACFBQW_02640 [Sphingomonadaceae bacterium]
MILWEAGALMLAAMAGAETAAPSGPAPQPRGGRVTVRRQLTIRMRAVPSNEVPKIRWRASAGPRCLATRSIAGATMLGPRSVDFILADRRRIRVELAGSCPALDFYYGFYVNAAEDGQLCAERDSIRSRVGGQCEIKRFHRLQAVPR